jgi:hypothetical protein
MRQKRNYRSRLQMNGYALTSIEENGPFTTGLSLPTKSSNSHSVTADNGENNSQYEDL